MFKYFHLLIHFCYSVIEGSSEHTVWRTQCLVSRHRHRLVIVAVNQGQTTHSVHNVISLYESGTSRIFTGSYLNAVSFTAAKENKTRWKKSSYCFSISSSVMQNDQKETKNNHNVIQTTYRHKKKQVYMLV